MKSCVKNIKTIRSSKLKVTNTKSKKRDFAVFTPIPTSSSLCDEGKGEFTVMLKDSGANKISVIKAIRELRSSLGLKEAKDLVDGAPKPVFEKVSKDCAVSAKDKLENAGATVELI